MTPTNHQRTLQAKRLEFLEKQVKELAREKHLTWILLEQSQPQVMILDADPVPAPTPRGLEQIKPMIPPRPDRFLSEYARQRIHDYPGMLFHTDVPTWQVGLTLDTNKLLFVPDALYQPYEQQCLRSVGWSEQQESDYEESIRVEDEATGEVSTPDWPNPVRRQGVWKARQVAHWTGETDTPELNYSVWANGTWG